MPRIYLDNASTTRTDPRVFESMSPFLTEFYGNPSSVHSFGQESRNAIDRSRRQVASLLNCSPNELIFTSGGTESNNIAIRGMAKRFSGGHIITSTIEHSAVREVVRNLAEDGYEITEIPSDEDGLIDPDTIRSAIQENTFLVSVMHANNEVGTIQRLSEISKVVSEFRESGKEIYLHSDSVQSLGKIPIDTSELGCDLMSFSAHKVYAPKGIGALYIRKSVRVTPLSKGGPHERGLRPGTENVAGIVAFGTACEIAKSELSSEAERIVTLRRRFEDTLTEKLAGIKINGGNERLPGIVNISFGDISGEALLIGLDQMGIAVSTGSACASGTIEPSHVLIAMGRSKEEAKSALRFSLGRFNQDDDVDITIKSLIGVVDSLRKI